MIPLDAREINTWPRSTSTTGRSVEPSIFGTLFERTLDPGKRSQIGAHYTSREDIETLLEPVLLAPLRREWEEVKRQCEEELWPAVDKAGRRKAQPSGDAPSSPSSARRSTARSRTSPSAWHDVTVLDPACGSGNFLYVAIHMLLDLEKEVIAYAADARADAAAARQPLAASRPGDQPLRPAACPGGRSGSATSSGCTTTASRCPTDPVLDPIETIRCMDAILDLSDPEHPKEPEWPEAEFIVGNPPFLGGKLLRANLGDEYVDAMFRAVGRASAQRGRPLLLLVREGAGQIETGR